MAKFTNKLSESFYREGKQEYRIKLIYRGQTPMVGISTFFESSTNQEQPIWLPGKKHFFMPLEAWKEFAKMVPEFAKQVEKGSLNYLYSLCKLRSYAYAIYLRPRVNSS